MLRARTFLPLLLVCVACSSSPKKRRRQSTPPPPPATAAPAPAPAPRPPEALLADAQAALAAGNHGQARELAAQATTAAPTRIAARLLIATSHLQDDGDLVATEVSLNDVLQADPGHLEAAFLLAKVREGQGRPDEARTLYERVADAGPAPGEANERLASLALSDGARAAATGNAAAAKEAYHRAVDRFARARAALGDRPAYAIGESRAHEGLGDLKGAEAALKRLVELLPDATGPHALLADFYERHGRKGDAKKERTLAGSDATPAKRKLRPLRPSR